MFSNSLMVCDQPRPIAIIYRFCKQSCVSLQVTQDNPKLLVHGQNVGCGLGLVSHSLSQQHLQIERSPRELPYLGKTPTRHGHREGQVEKVWQSECYCSLSIMDLGVSREKMRAF